MNLEMLVQLSLAGLGVYLACGVVFAVPFVWGGVNHIDSHAKPGSVGFRILIVPGTIFLWPLLLRRWMRGTRVPPEERNAPGELDRTELHNQTGRHSKAEDLTRALKELLRLGLATSRKEKTTGAPRELWRAVAN